MPTYEYRCTKCGKHSEAFQKMSDAPLKECPHCHEESLQRVVSGGAGVLYKGEGWYVTDYSRKSSGGKETPPKKEESKSEGSGSSASNTSSSGSASGSAAKE